MNLTELLRNISFHSEAPKGSLNYEIPKNLRNPWPGLAAYKDPFTSKSKYMFCGRDRESFEVTRMIDDNVFVTLYGKSGNGKTSLLNAGVFPQLRQMQYVPISIRLGTEPLGRSFQESIIHAIENTIKAEYRETIWIIPPMQNKNSNEYLWNYFARQRFYADLLHENPVFPVIVLDQFEEVYRKRKSDANVLLRQISYLMDESHELESCEIDGLVYEYEYNFRFVVSIREDDLFLLEDSLDNNYLQDMKLTRYRLLPITSRGARDVILNPAKKEDLFAEEEKEEIVKTITSISKGKSDSVSSNVLSLICNRIYVHYYERQGGNGHISFEFVKQFVSENPLEKFYLEATKHLNRTQRTYLEDNLVDMAERRGSVSKANFENIFKKRGESLLSGPFKILQESNDRVELIHDSFCRILLNQKAKRMERWRTIVEHIGLMFICIIICIMVCLLQQYTDRLPPVTSFENIIIYPLYLIVVWAVFLFDVIGMIRHSIPSNCLWVSVAMLIYPPLVSAFILKESPSLPRLYYLVAFILVLLLAMCIWVTRKDESRSQKEKETFSSLLDVKSLRVWLFVFFIFCLYYVLYKSGRTMNIAEKTFVYYLTILPALFYSIFESKESLGWFMVMLIMMPVSFMLYCTSDVEYLNITINSFTDYIFYFGWCLGCPAYCLWLILISREEKKTSGIVTFITMWGGAFALYSLLYQYKIILLIVWCFVFYSLLVWIEGKKVLPLYLATFLFSIGLYILMKGFNPIINGVQINNQADNWRWNNVIAYNGKEYRLVDALTGKDLLGLGFNRQEKYNELVLDLHDSLNIGYSVKNSLMNVSGDNKELVYTVIPEFETHIRKQVAKGNIVSLVFQENRQCIFHCLHGSRIITENKERNQQTLGQLLDNEQQKIASILENGNDSIVKSQISRQLCKGVSCSWLFNSLGKDYSVNDDAFFGYLVAFVNNTNSYYFEKLYDFNNIDWDGDFEKMMQAYITLRKNRKEKPQDQFLQLTIPLLITYYNETKDYGLKTSLYSKIVRLQQLAILYGLGDNDWAHESLPSPVGIDINTFYRENR